MSPAEILAFSAAGMVFSLFFGLAIEIYKILTKEG